MMIYPYANGPTFAKNETHMNIGLYSLHGLNNVAFIYGFGTRYECYLRKRLIAAFADDPKKKDEKMTCGCHQEEDKVANKEEAEEKGRTVRSTDTKKFMKNALH